MRKSHIIKSIREDESYERRSKSALQSDYILKNMFNLNKIDVNALVKEKAKSQEKIERSQNNVFNAHVNAINVKFKQVSILKMQANLFRKKDKSCENIQKKETFHMRKFKLKSKEHLSENSQLMEKSELNKELNIKENPHLNEGQHLPNFKEKPDLIPIPISKVKPDKIKKPDFKEKLNLKEKIKLPQNELQPQFEKNHEKKENEILLKNDENSFEKEEIFNKEVNEIKKPSLFENNKPNSNPNITIITPDKEILEKNQNIEKKLKNLELSQKNILQVPNLRIPRPKAPMFQKSKTLQINEEMPFSPIHLKKSGTKSIFEPSMFSNIQSSPINSKSPCLHKKNSEEIESPSKLVEKIYVKMSNYQDKHSRFSLIPQKVDYQMKKNQYKIITKNSVPSKKDLGKSKYSHLKKRFIKEYFYAKEDQEQDEKAESLNPKKFDNVIFCNLSANALASHHWNKKIAQNNAFLMKSFSPDFVEYPNSPKFTEFNAFLRNFNRAEKMDRHCLSKQACQIKKNEKSLMKFTSQNDEYLKSYSHNKKKNKSIYGMSFSEYEDVINLWKIDHLKGEIPDIGQAYAYMKIIKTNNNKKNDNHNKSERNVKKNSSDKKDTSFISPKTTDRSKLFLEPKKDAMQIDILSPTDKNMTHSFFSPINTSQSGKKKSPRFSVRSPSRRYTKSPIRKRSAIQLFS